MGRNEIFVLFFFLLIQFSGIYAKNLTRSDLLRRLTNKTTYDPNYPPGYDNGDPIRVIVQLDIFDLPSISDQEMQYSLMMLMRVQWQDERLAFKDLANFSQLYLTGERVELVWRPDLYIKHERKSDAHSFIKSEKLVYMNPDGTVTFSERFSMTNVCHMDLMQYPFDEQKCVITIMSYAITSDDMILQWSKNSVLAVEFDLPNYDISVIDKTDGISPGDSKSLAGGRFSHLNVTLKLVRKSGAYGSMYFAPFPLFFIIAMASFGFRDQMTSRITVCTTGISSSVLQWIAIYSRLPPVWYLTYLDCWIIVHIVIIGGLLVYHSIWYMCSHQSRKEQDQFEDLIREVENMTIDARDYKCLTDFLEQLSIESARTLTNALENVRNTDEHFTGYLKSSRGRENGQDEYRTFADVEKVNNLGCKSMETLLNSDQLSRKARSKLINDQRYMLICDKDRKKYYENYMKRKDNKRCIKAFKKNIVDFVSFVVFLVIYLLSINILLIKWKNAQWYYIFITIGGVLGVYLVYRLCLLIYRKCKNCKNCKQTRNENIEEQGNVHKDSPENRRE